MIGTVWEVQFTYEDFPFDLNRELYEECLERTRGVEERDMTDVDEEELEEEQDPRVRTTSSGRILKLPNRFYWKHGLIKAQWVERQRNSEELKATIISFLFNHIKLD